jgi:hypothetical protein
MELTTRTEPETLWIIGPKAKKLSLADCYFARDTYPDGVAIFQNDIHCRFTFPDGKTEQHRFRAGETLYMKDYPITGTPNADTVALERLDASWQAIF